MKNTKKTVTLESNEAIQKSGNNHLTSLNFIKKSGLNNMHKAFTLVELIVVITILAILGTIAFISFQNYTQSARDGTRIADINSIKKNLELFITEKGFYPLPDNGTQITYSGGTAWVQGTVGDNVITNLGRINKKPTDPLSNNEYTYSVTNSKTEYQLSYVTEGGLSYNTPLTNQTYAATTKTATAKVSGTYNEKILKVSTGGTTYILAVPSIINANLAITNLPTIITNKSLVYNNYQNLPDSYKNLGYTMTGGFDFAPANIVVLSGSTISLSGDTDKITFLNNLKQIYNTTILNQDPTYIEIINTTDANKQVALVDNYITNHVGGITGIISTTTQTYSCATQPNYVHATYTAGTPTQVNQPQQNTTNTNPCYYVCKDGYTGSDCSIAPITGWRVLDPNCLVNDIVVGTQTWAGCNSTLGNGFERGKKSDGTNGTIGSCYNYDGATNVVNCPIGATSMASNTSATTFFNAMQPDGTNVNQDAEVNNIWGKLYTWANAPSACPTGRHLPSDANWETLETTLNGGTNCRNATDGWLCDGLGWKSNVSYNPDRKLAETLKIPLAGYRYTDGTTFDFRGNYALLWSSTPVSTSAYSRSLYRNYSSVYRGSSSQLVGFSVRCIKD